MRTFLIGGAIAALVLAPAAVAAQPAPPPPPGVAPGTAPPLQVPAAPGMKQMRVRVMSDRVMTRDEVAAHVAKLFAKLDANRDGFVTRQEVEAFHAKMMAATGKGGDIGAHLARRGVFLGDKGAMFDRLDTNHDGSISRQEFMASRPQVREERVMVMRSGSDGAPGAHGALPPMDGHPGMEMHMRHMGGMRGMGMGGFGGHLFEMADANHDGRVSLAEAQTAALAHFDKADLNHDGKITPDERRQGHRARRIERGQG